MGCCGDGNNQNQKVKEWGKENQSGRSINIKFVIIGVILILIGVFIYKFIM